jgi:hypothetical protein
MATPSQSATVSLTTLLSVASRLVWLYALT